MQNQGCDKCRSRKVKCDRTKPICQRCEKIGNQSCAYRDQFDSILRNQTSRTAERAREKWRSRSKKVAASSEEPLPADQSPSAQASQSSGESGSLDELVHRRFYHDWVIENAPPGAHFMEFLPGLYNKAPKDSVLATAMRALAYANYSMRCNSPGTLSLAIANCNTAMSDLNHVIDNPTEAFSDETLAAINLLGLYEVGSN
jgi:hypothetical protein